MVFRNGYASVDFYGQSIGLKFGMNFWRILAESYGLKADELHRISEFLNEQTLKQHDTIGRLVYAAALANSEISGKAIDISIPQATEWVWDSDTETINTVVETFLWSKMMGKTIAEWMNEVTMTTPQ